MLEKKVISEFLKFSKRRFSSKYNTNDKNIIDEFYFSSCGNDFFRDRKELEKILLSTNSKYTKPYNYLFIKNINSLSLDDINLFNLYFENSHLPNEYILKENRNIITFNVCRTNKMPIITKIQLTETFSTNPDFHSMPHNKQMENYDIYYVWVLFKWVEYARNDYLYLD